MKLTSTAKVTAEFVDDLGHLNHALGLRFLEYARDEWYAAAGLWEGRPWSEAEHLGTIIVNLNVNYRRECFLGELLQIVTGPVSRGTKSFRIAQEMRKPDGSVAIDCVATSLIMDMRVRESIPVPDALAKHFPTN